MQTFQGTINGENFSDLQSFLIALGNTDRSKPVSVSFRTEERYNDYNDKKEFNSDKSSLKQPEMLKGNRLKALVPTFDPDSLNTDDPVKVDQIMEALDKELKSKLKRLSEYAYRLDPFEKRSYLKFIIERLNTSRNLIERLGSRINQEEKGIDAIDEEIESCETKIANLELQKEEKVRHVEFLGHCEKALDEIQNYWEKLGKLVED